MSIPDITVSIVSHGQNALVNQLLGDIENFCTHRVALVLTENIPDTTPLATSRVSCSVVHILNDEIKGFGANHNAAFARCKTPYFCVCNPDIRLPSDPFAPLLQSLADPRVAAAGPLVRNPAGKVEDSARRFPTAASLLKKAFLDKRQPDYPVDRGPQEVDWIAGMFVLFRSDAYRAVGGFDEAYFLYYEDVDLCHRFGAAGLKIVYDPRGEAVHDARRGSRENLRLALHHTRSVIRFLTRSI